MQVIQLVKQYMLTGACSRSNHRRNNESSGIKVNGLM